MTFEHRRLPLWDRRTYSRSALCCRSTVGALFGSNIPQAGIRSDVDTLERSVSCADKAAVLILIAYPACDTLGLDALCHVSLYFC